MTTVFRKLNVFLLSCSILITTLLPATAQVTLSGTSYSENFNGIGSALPTGWTVRTSATATALGTSTTLATTQTSWATTTGNFRNTASANGLTSTATATTQNASTDRALSVRQTGSFGDPGAAFVLQLANTTGFQNFAMTFRLQSLDASSTRTTTWRVDYGTGASPATFTDAGASGTLTTGNSTFSNNSIAVNFGSALNNLTGPVWIRIVTVSGSGGSSNRATTGIDDVSVTFDALGSTNPSLATNPATRSGFTTTVGTPSAIQTYTLTGSNLTANVAITAPAGFEISSDGSTFSGTLSVAPGGGSVSSVISVRLTGAGAGSPSGTITNVSTSASSNVTVSGQVNQPGGQFTPIATARGFSDNTTTTIAGRVTVSDQFGGRLFYIQDKTGGIAIYSGASPAPTYGSQVQLGDSVQITGPIGTFQGKKEINGVTSFTLVPGALKPVTPKDITPSQMAAYEGQLVKISQATIAGAGPNFAGSTNYPFTASSQSSEIRIDPNTAIVGRGKPTGAVDVIGISDRFTSGGTDILQLLPRNLTDLPTTEPVVVPDQYCGGTGGSNLTRDQTFDISAWNLEFFGAGAGSITCPTSPNTRTYDNQGPTNEDLQGQNVGKVLQKLTADVVVLEEVSDQARLTQIVSTSLSGYSLVCSDKFSYYFQDQCDQSVDGNGKVFGPTSLAQKVCVVYKTSTVTPILAESKALLTNLYTYPGSNGWASGRLPYMFVANVTINGVTKKLNIVGIHAKSGSAIADYNRRKQDYADLKAELDANYPTANIVLLGDYNDQILSSIASGQPSSFKAFDDDAANYNVLTKSLESQNCITFQSGSFLDHITISNDLAPAYVANTVSVLTPGGIDNYNVTTSDHFPVTARFDLSKLNPANPTGLALTAPTYNCSTGAFTFNTTGGDGSPITFFAIGIAGPTTNPNQYVDKELRTAADARPITLSATQGSTTVTYVWDIRAACSNQPPTTSLALTTPTYNCSTGAFTFNTTGGDGSPITFFAIGIAGPTTNPNQYVDKELRTAADARPITLSATQGSTTVTYVWDIRAACSNQAPSTGLALTAPTYNCSTGAFTFNTTGGNGSPITFFAIGIAGPTTNPNQFVDKELRTAADAKPITLSATQGSTTVTYVWDIRAQCPVGARVGALEETPLEIQVLGNPVQHGEVVIEVRGAANQPLSLLLTDLRGQLIHAHQVEQAGVIERHTFSMNQQAAGMFMLRATTPTQSKTVKLIKVD